MKRPLAPGPLHGTIAALSAVFAVGCGGNEPAGTGTTATASNANAAATGAGGSPTAAATGMGGTVGGPTAAATTGVGGASNPTAATATTTAGVGGANTVTTTSPTTTVGGATTTGGGGETWDWTGPRTPPAPGAWPPPAITLTKVADLDQPTAIAAPRFDPSRIYVAEKWGQVRLIKDGQLLPEPALDIRDAVLEGGPSQGGTESPHQGKRGLVGLALHPHFETNGRMFVMYTADQGVPGYGTVDNSNIYDDGDMTIEEYRRSDSDPDKFDPASATIILQWDKGDCQQCSQHNGGSLELDTHGFLWASTGDPPPYDNPGSQDLNSFNGKLLRFDISGDTVVAAGNYPGADAYISSIGIRNTYKFSFDRYTGDMYVGDVGENTVEELTIEPYGMNNRNHGWPVREGTSVLRQDPCDDCLDPVFEYDHGGPEGTPGADTCIIGGYVYRGSAIPGLQGTYIYGDFGSGKIRGLQVQNGALVNGPHDFGPTAFMGCFGEDAAGELYVCDYEGNQVMRIDAQ